MLKSSDEESGRLKVSIEREAIRFGERLSVSFQRTLRIPDDGKTYPLPPGLGVFPIFAVRDYVDRVGPDMRVGDAFIPMYQREALWLGFDAADWKPNAVKVAVGRINALSGQPDDKKLHANPQDYLVCPDQPWLDGVNSGKGTIRQFVAMPLGEGYTIESAISGVEEFGGIQITAYEPKPGKFPDRPELGASARTAKFAQSSAIVAAPPAMGLGAGGTMKQKIYPDSYGIETWDQDNYGRVVVHIVNSEHFRQLTGLEPPSTPVSAQAYTEHGFPWFDLYDESQQDIASPDQLREVKTVADRDKEKGETATGNEPVDVPDTQVVKLDPHAPGPRGRGPSRPGSVRPKRQKE